MCAPFQSSRNERDLHLSSSAQVMFSKPMPEVSCQLNAWVTMLTCQWLMGPCKVLPQSPSAQCTCSHKHPLLAVSESLCHCINMHCNACLHVVAPVASDSKGCSVTLLQVNDVELDGGRIGSGQGVLVERCAECQDPCLLHFEASQRAF